MKRETINDFAVTIAKILKSDRWVLVVCDGDMGEGKSCFTSQLAKAIAKKVGTSFNYSGNMTFRREELKKWVDGDKDGKGRKPEYSVILADEIISMFFKRNWFDFKQIDGIELLNKCRDRHLCVIGNVPHFWDLDSAIYAIVTFRVHIFERGLAWVFMKDRNPFTDDKWHKKLNEKKWIKAKNPFSCIGYTTQILFPDWGEKEKEKYYLIRNQKRVKTEGQRGRERYGDIKEQRDEILRFLFHYNAALVKKGKAEPITHKAIADIVGLDRSAISYIVRGSR